MLDSSGQLGGRASKLEALSMAILAVLSAALAEQGDDWWIDAPAQRLAEDAVLELRPVPRKVGGRIQRAQLVHEPGREDVIGIECENPRRFDPRLVDGEVPLRGMGIKVTLHEANVGKGFRDAFRVVATEAVDHNDLWCPGERSQRARDVRRLIECEDNGCYGREHQRSRGDVYL